MNAIIEEKIIKSLNLLNVSITHREEEEGKLWLSLSFQNGMKGEMFIAGCETPGYARWSWNLYCPWKANIKHSGKVGSAPLRARTLTETKGLLLEAAEQDIRLAPTAEQKAHAEKHRIMMLQTIASVEAIAE